MDIGQIGDDGWTSVRTSWREERWLPAGLVLAGLAYALWIGLTGAAVGFLAEAVSGGVPIDPWTGGTTVLVAVVGLLWIVGPAALAVVLVTDRVTNVNGNLRAGYRLRHPLLLLVPPAAVLAVSYGALVGTGSASPLVVGLLVGGALWFAVRTTAYAYRVFSLSLPIVATLLLFASAVVLAGTILIQGGLAVGRSAIVADLLVGLAVLTGVPEFATLHTATADVGGVGVPLAVALSAAVPVGGGAAYVGVQLVWSLFTRLRRPNVRRPELRTGQRYPRFARPTTNANPRSVGRVSAGSPGDGGGVGDSVASAGTSSERTDAGSNASGPSGSSGAAAAGDEDATDPEAAERDEMDDVTHTRVFTPPDDATVASPEDLAAGSGDGGRETTAPEDGLEEQNCPTCGERVEATAAVCPICDEDLESV